MLEIEEDQVFQERVWIFQRVGWGLLILFLALAATGFTGPSPFTRVVMEKNGHRVEYPRFARMGTVFEMIVTPANGEEVFLSREILRKNEIETVMPLPERGEARREGIALRFAEGEGGDIYMDWQPREAGWTNGRVVVGSPPVEFRLKQFVYY